MFYPNLDEKKIEKTCHFPVRVFGNIFRKYSGAYVQWMIKTGTLPNIQYTLKVRCFEVQKT